MTSDSANINPASPPRVLMVAAEASSALYAQRLLEHWEGRDFEAFGVGSQEMVDIGFKAIGKAEEMAVMGLQEVVSHWDVISKAYKSILEECKKNPPKFALLLDYPGFNLRLAKDLKKLGIPVVYYISPHIWAWKKKRIHKIKKVVDKMLVLFPFEVELYEKHNVDVEFVGHPLVDEIDSYVGTAEELQRRKDRYGFGKNKVVALMPGSRHSELKYILEPQIKAAEELYKKYPSLNYALFVAPTLDLKEVKLMLPKYGFPLTIIKEEPLKMIPLADIVLCASGTATLFVGLFKKPLVVMYKMNAFTVFIGQFLVRSLKFFGLVNIVMGREVAPELFQGAANVDNLVKHMEVYISDSKAYEAAVSDLSLVREKLGNDNVTQKVSDAIERFW